MEAIGIIKQHRSCKGFLECEQIFWKLHSEKATGISYAALELSLHATARGFREVGEN
jgi:hypothetical protein